LVARDIRGERGFPQFLQQVKKRGSPGNSDSIEAIGAVFQHFHLKIVANADGGAGFGAMGAFHHHPPFIGFMVVGLDKQDLDSPASRLSTVNSGGNDLGIIQYKGIILAEKDWKILNSGMGEAAVGTVHDEHT